MNQAAHIPSRLFCVYDLAKTPVTFDFSTYLAIADCYRQLSNLDLLSIEVNAHQYRMVTPRDKQMPMDEKFWRIRNIFQGMVSLLPTVAEYKVSAYPINPIDGPTFPPDISVQPPYYATYLVSLHRQGADPKVLKASGYAMQMVRQQFGDRFVTLTLRTSRHFTDHNPDMEDWYKFYKYILSTGMKVVVIPDQEDIFTDKQYQRYDWTICETAAVDMGLRFALNQVAKTNFCSSNGSCMPMFYSNCSLYQFDQLRGNGFHADHQFWKDINGIEVGENFAWNRDDQRLTWVNSDFDTLKRYYDDWARQYG